MFLKAVLEKTIKNISRIFILQTGENSPDDYIEEIDQFILAVMDRQQRVYGLGLIALLLYFNFVQLFKGGRTFNRLSRREQERVVGRWSTSSLGFKRNFVRFFLGLTLMAFCDSPKFFQKNNYDFTGYLSIQSFYNSC